MEINKIPDQFLKNRVIVLVLKGLLDKVLHNIHYLILLTIFPSPLEFETTDSCSYVILFFLLFVFLVFNRCQSSWTTITNWRLRVNLKQQVASRKFMFIVVFTTTKNHLDLRFSIRWNSAVLQRRECFMVLPSSFVSTTPRKKTNVWYTEKNVNWFFKNIDSLNVNKHVN